MKVGEGISGWVVQNGKPVLVKDIEIHPIFGKKPNPKYATKSFVSTPLIYQNRAIGVIHAIDKTSSSGDHSIFCEEDVKFLSIIAHYVAIAIENARLFEKKHQLSITDPLTGLYNYRRFQEHLEKEVERARRYSHPLSVIMIDIDHFKNYNDTHGHLKGNDILKGVADTMRENVREVDIVTRCGGEEFATILPDTDIEGGLAVAEKMRGAIEKRPFELEEFQPGGRLTISAGVGSLQRRMKKKDELIDEADKALYQAKKEGRNRVCVYKNF